jgi:hypothetical protein
MIPLCAFGFLFWIDTARIHRVEYVSGTEGWSAAGAAAAAASPAGDSGGPHQLVVPEHDNESYEWLDQTRQMFAQRELRVRHIAYENAPFGREEHAASPYRWWLGLIAWVDHALSGNPLDLTVERAALFADPLLHMLLLVATAAFVAWQFGFFPAAIFSLCLVALFPFAAEFIPGAPDDHGLAQACAIWSVLPLLAGLRAAHSAAPDAGRRGRRWFFLAGIAGGIGLWVSVSHEVPLLLGIALGALMAAGVARDDPTGAQAGAPWRTWALGGAASSLGAFLIEYFPANMGTLELRAIHPLYGLAWLGGGEVLAQAEAWIRRKIPVGPPPNPGGVLKADSIEAAWMERRKPERSRRDNVAGALAVLALATVPVVMWRTRDLGFMGLDLPALRLARLPDSPVATDLPAWILRDGLSSRLWATLLPLLLVGPSLWLLARRGVDPGARAAIIVALGPVMVALGFAFRELTWWNGVAGVLLVLLTAAAASMPGSADYRAGRWALAGFAVLVLLPGAIQIRPRPDAGARIVLSETEEVGRIERDLARWLAIHTGPAAVVLAPFNETVTLYYYGGLRGLATYGWENREGMAAAIRIYSASTPEEAREMIERREISLIVLPSWDTYLDTYAHVGPGQLEDTFVGRLRRWELPPWLRPVPYPLLKFAGFEGQSVAIFEVVPDQDDATAEGRLAEYFAEMEQTELAASAEAALRRFPSDLGALVARAQVEFTRADTDGFAQTVDLVLHRVSGGADRALPWDRRVSLAVVLAQAQQVDLARMEVIRCLEEVDEAKLRGLTTGSLYRLQVLSNAFGLGIADAHLRAVAFDLLPPEYRKRFEP